MEAPFQLGGDGAGKRRVLFDADLVVDSTGLKVFGEGEWLENKHKPRPNAKMAQTALVSILSVVRLFVPI
ncbi:hypothetical protein [Mesorhizobium sp. M1409]|uniref:hypothetical protein n=1 Tax=unclassified Mesorhizobium TaxID=325217 RepID=UPI00333BCFAA